MANTQTKKLSKWSVRMFQKVVITRDSDGSPYIVRYNIFACYLFSIKLHHILRSDDDCLHDHPWSFISIILKGGYFERTPRFPKLFDIRYTKAADYLLESEKDRMAWGAAKKKWYKPGSILFRSAEYRHSLEIPEGKTAWSLVLTGRVKRHWGFWNSRGWIHHSEYQSKSICD